MIKRTPLAALACAFTATLLAATTEPQLDELAEVTVSAKVALPIKDFVELPKYDSVVVSPSGKMLAMAWADNNFQRQITVIEIPSLKPVANYNPGPVHAESELRWANERRLMLQVRWPLRAFLRLREPLGVMSFTDLNGGNSYNINYEGVGNPMDPFGLMLREQEAWAISTRDTTPDIGKWPGKNALGPVRVIDNSSKQSDTLLFQTLRTSSRSGKGDGYGAFQLDLKNNKQTRVATLPVAGGQFVTGPENRIALATGVNAKNEAVVYYLPANVRAGGKDWQLLVSSASGTRGLVPIAWTGQGEEYFALDGRSTPTKAVVLWNAATNTQRVVYRNTAVDMDSVSLDINGWPWMFSGSDHFPVHWYPDPNHPLAKLHKMLVQKAPRELVEILNTSDNLAVAVVRVSSGRRPPTFLIVDVASGNSMTGLYTYPTLRGARLSQVDPFEFVSRDGVSLRGYVTNPEDGEGKPRRGLPMVVIAHDGPLGVATDSQYEYERQVFASRGYAVLQVNRRGTSGRGASLERAGDGMWGRETQEDYADGVHWAIKDGVADPERICFYGSGWGAYSAVITAVREPDMFKCVIGVSGLFDLPLWLGEGKKEIPPALVQVLGNDMAAMKARSPISFAGAIKAKVLLIPQERDEYFPPEQSNNMRNAMRDANNAAASQKIGQEYDGLHIPATRANGYDIIFKFLDQQIGH